MPSITAKAQKRTYATGDVSPLLPGMPKTGLEPAPPLQGLGPEPSASANSATSAPILLF